MNDILSVGQWRSASLAALVHREHWTLCLCSSGTGYFRFDKIAIPYQAGSLIVIPPEAPFVHECAEESAFLYLIAADASLAFRHPLILDDDANHSLQRLFEDMLYHFSTEFPARGTLLNAYGQLIAQHISVRRIASPRTQMVEDIAQHIAQNYANPNYELDALLRSAPYCYDYLCRIFRQELHTTPHKYLTDLRLQSAADILRTGSERSVTEIAHMCGYSDPLYFSRMFKKRYGVSPKGYAGKE